MVSPLIAARVAADYPESQRHDVIDLLDSLVLDGSRLYASPAGRERVQAAVLKNGHGDIDALLVSAADAEKDWRDVLAAAGFENEDWPDRVMEFLSGA